MPGQHIPMKTLADVKRRLVPNTICHIIYAKYGFSWPGIDGDDMRAGRPALRIVKENRSNDIVFSTGRGTASHLSWPKAASLRIDGPDTFTILEAGAPLLTYRISETVNAEVGA